MSDELGTSGIGVAPGGRRVIGVLGPTGVGKTAVALELAGLLGTRIISCDSMQIYRAFPVLTNQPSLEEQRAVAHELVGIAEPGEAFSAAEYGDRAGPLIDEDVKTHGRALAVGGTGLYMRAALAPLAVRGGGDPALRARLEARAVDEGAGALHAELVRLDPEAAGAIDPRNVRRVMRALEAVHTTGHAWSGRDDLWAPVYYHPTLVVGLVSERAGLYERIDARAARIFEGGAVEEVRRFRHERGAEETEPRRAGICSAIGYAEICGYLEGRLSEQEAVTQIAAATRRYARRQLTWLRKLRDAVIIDVRGRAAWETALEIVALARSGECTKESRHP